MHTDIDTKAINSGSLPLAVQYPIPPPILVSLSSSTSPATPTTPFTLETVITFMLSTSNSDILQFQPPCMSLLQRIVSVAADDRTKLMVSSTPPTTAMMTTPLLSVSPLKNRLSVAMVALACPTVPWTQLLVRRISTLFWDNFTKEMMNLFGDSEAWKPKSTTVRQEIPSLTTSTMHTFIDTKTINCMSLSLAVQQPIPPLVLVHLSSPTSPPTPATPPTLATVKALMLSTCSTNIPQFQAPCLPLLQGLVSAAVADHTKLMVSSTPPTTAIMKTPLLSASHDNLQI